MKRALILLLPLVAVCTACDIFLPENMGTDELIEYRAEDYEGDRIVIHGLLSAEHGVVAEVGVSRRPGTKKANQAKGLHVYLMEDGEKRAELLKRTVPLRDSADFTANFAYSLPTETYRIEAGKAYSLRAEAEGLPTAESDEVRIAEARVEVDTVYAETDQDGLYRRFVLRGRTTEAGVSMAGFTRYYREGKVYIGGCKYPYGMAEERSMAGDFVRASSRGRSPYKLDSVRVEVLELTGDVAEFYKTIEAASEADNDPYTDRIVNVLSNVRGGYGFVGTYKAHGATIVADSLNREVVIDKWATPETDKAYYDPYFAAY